MEQARKEILARGGSPASRARRPAETRSDKSGGAMAWDTELNPVVSDLSSTFSDFEIIRDIAIKSGLSMPFVRYTPDAESYWTAVLERAQDEGRERVDSVFKEALSRTKNQQVRDTIESYQQARNKQ
jgi:hypothetical protein